MIKNATILFFLLCFSALNGIDTHAQVLPDGQPSVLKEDKAQSNYVYDLKVLIQKSRDNIKNVNEKIKDQAVRKRNQQREEKAREYFLQAQKLAEEGLLEESRQLYDKAIRVTEHPEMKYYIRESQHRAKVQEVALSRQETELQRRSESEEKDAFERVENMYQGAVSLYKQQRYKEAKEELLTVDEIYPEYKAVRSYLQIIEQDMALAEHRQMKDQKKEIELQQKELEIARLREKELWRKEINRKEEERQKQLMLQAQGVYDKAIGLYQDHQYMAAQEKFQEVEWVTPDFKATRAYLQRIERDIVTDKLRLSSDRQKILDKQRWEEALALKKAEEDRKKALEVRQREKFEQNKDQAEFVYQSAMSLFNKDKYVQAREKFDEVEALYPDYKSTRNYLKRIIAMQKTAMEKEEEQLKFEAEKKLWEETAARRREEKIKFQKVTDEADALYTEAFNLYKMGRLIESKEKFLEVDQRIPDYKSTRTYLKRIDEDIVAMVAANRKEGDLASQKAQLERLKELRDRADVVYNEAIVAYDKKDFPIAKLKFQAAESIYPNYKKSLMYLSRIDEDIEAQKTIDMSMKQEKAVDGLYSQALLLYQKSDFEGAKAKFIELVAINPDYKQAAFYLERIDDDIIRHKQQSLDNVQNCQADTLYTQAVTAYQLSDYSLAKTKFLELEAVSSNFKDTAKYLATIDSDIQRKKSEIEAQARTAIAQEIYKQALDAYQAGDYTVAKEKFIQTEVIYPDYKDTVKYLKLINLAIKKKSIEAELKQQEEAVEPTYAEALALYKAQELVEAKKKFLQVQSLYPEYKNVDFYLKRVDKDIRLLEERLVREEKLRQAEGAYSTAMKLYSENKFDEAKIKFKEVSGLDPNYRSVRGYLARIDNDIRVERERLAKLLLQSQAEQVYAQAVALYHEEKYETAKLKFQETDKIITNYKKTKSYLTGIEKDIVAQKTEEGRQQLVKAESLYRQAVLLSEKGEPVKTYQKYSEVEALVPNFKDTRRVLTELKADLLKRDIALSETILAAAPVVPAQVMMAVTVDQDPVLTLYKEAVGLYKNKKYLEARVKFNEVQALSPGYRSTQRYFDMIESFEPKAQELKTTIAAGDKAKAYLEAFSLVEPIYLAALELYKSGRYEEARVKFQEVEAVSKGYKSTSEYLWLISRAKGNPTVTAERKVLARNPKVVMELSQKSGDLYRQIRSLADDKDLVSSTKLFSKIDKIVASLEIERKRLARTIQDQQKQGQSIAAHVQEKETQERLLEEESDSRREALKQKLQEKHEEEAAVRAGENQKELQAIKQKEKDRLSQVREQEKEMRLQAEVLYQQGLVHLKDKKYSVAKERFMDAQKVLPGYKDTDELLWKVERAEGEILLLEGESADRELVIAVAAKAGHANTEALTLAEMKDFSGLQQKYDELSSMLKEIQVIKGRMVDRRENFRIDWENKLKRLHAKSSAEKMPVKGMKPNVEGRTVRQQAEAFYKEGQQFYTKGQHPEARVKFSEAFAVDSSFKAAYTYVQRIDRILSNKDFEEQNASLKKENRQLEKRQEGSESDHVKMFDAVRAKELDQEGVDLYKMKRYKEARIKFEELMKVGNVSQTQKAERYLGLVEASIEKDKKDDERKKLKEQERYLEEKRAAIRLNWERDKGMQAKQATQATGKAVSAHTGQQLSVERQLLLRNIDKENDAERKKMLVSKFNEQNKAEKSAHAKSSKVKKMTSKLEGQPIPFETADQQKPKGSSIEVGAIDRTEDLKFQRMIGDQRRAQLKEESRRLIFAERQRRVEELAKMRMEERKRRNEEALIRRNQKEVEAVLSDRSVLKEAAPVVAVKRSQEKTLTAAIGDHSSVAMAGVYVPENEEKSRLDTQHRAIQRDLEAGVDRLYLEAIALYKRQQYDRARVNFEQVNALIVGYKKTAQYLLQIEKKSSPNNVTSASPNAGQSSSSIKVDNRQEAISNFLDKIETNTLW